ncbi:ABC transporter substrate-binding protein [Reinekea marina]|uniref:ABC transporter substrate-binding protein n=1 Tax=Reinekea marina TaxID=1310421 RepID=A0ABV7WMP7_9GAMM|nr:ABC transporter substrate-binding protein [Reinekea marina]MDN3650703.1 ABC transporter substrate-binding protein [Reinekea marina]
MPTLFRTLIVISISLFSSLVFATDYPLTVTDGMGNTITLQKAPERISSKTLFTDEIFSEILSPSKLSSISDIANDANFSNIADKLPKGVALMGLNVEQILSNYPDIVFAANWSDSGVVEQIKQAGITVYLVNTPFTIEAIQAEIEKISQIVDATEQGEQLLANMNQNMAALNTKIQDIKNAELVALDYNTWGTSSGVDSTWHALVTAAGIENAAARFEQGSYGQVTMSKELILEINPDILFLPGWIYGDDKGAEQFMNSVKNDPALKDVAAVKNNRIYAVPENLRGTYSQYIADTLAYVVNKVHSDIE